MEEKLDSLLSELGKVRGGEGEGFQGVRREMEKGIKDTDKKVSFDSKNMFK